MGLFDLVNVTESFKTFSKSHGYSHEEYTQIKITKYMLEYFEKQNLLTRDPEYMTTFLTITPELRALFEIPTDCKSIPYSHIRMHLKKLYN